MRLPSSPPISGSRPVLRAWALGVLLCTGGCATLRAPVPLESRTTFQTRTGTFELNYSAVDQASAAMVQQAIELADPRVQRWGALRRPVVVHIEPSHEALERAVDRPGYPWLRAWARDDVIFLQSPRTWSRAGASQLQVDELLAHELTHCVMYQQASPGDQWRYKGIPIWFREGMASVTAGQGYRRATLADVKKMMESPGGDPVADAERLYQDSSEGVYAAAHHAFAFLVKRYGDEGVRAILAAMDGGARFDDAFRRAIGLSRTGFEQEFRRYVRMEGWRTAAAG